MIYVQYTMCTIQLQYDDYIDIDYQYNITVLGH